MKTSKKGLDLIREFEGCELKVYRDIVGRATIGIGHLIKPEEDFSKGIDLDDAYKLLMLDVLSVEYFLNRQAFRTPLNQNKFDSLISFGFNLGIGSLHLLLSHGVENIPTEILKWDHAGGKVVEGLTRRRQVELSLWETPVDNVPLS